MTCASGINSMQDSMRLRDVIVLQGGLHSRLEPNLAMSACGVAIPGRSAVLARKFDLSTM
jgi:hypothetical protein